MKSIRITLINRFLKSCFFKLIVIDLVLFLLFRHYQPLCEPCLDNDCPPCVSKEQYIIIYIGIVLNILGFIICIYKTVKNKQKNNKRGTQTPSQNNDK